MPAGRYARAVIDALAEDPEFGPEYAAQLLENVVSHELNVRGVLQKVALGEADAGFVYVSDLVSTDNILALAVPPEANAAAVYPIAILLDAAKPEFAQIFIQFLTSPRGQRILQDHGFGPAGSRTAPNSGSSSKHPGVTAGVAYSGFVHDPRERQNWP